MAYLVSILIPTYNRSLSLRMAIESALRQSYKHIEIIVSDNKSTDETALIVAEFKDKRIKYYVNEENIGPILNWRNALEKANGQIGIILCDDDYFLDEHYITDAVSLFEKHDSINLVITDCVLGLNPPRTTQLGLDEYLYGINFFKNFWTRNFNIPVISNVFKIDCVLKLKVLQDNGVLYSDIEMWLKLMLIGDVAYIERPTVYYSFHEENIVNNMTRKQLIYNAKFIKNICELMEEEGFLVTEISNWRRNFVVRYIFFIKGIYGNRIDKEMHKKIFSIAGVKWKWLDYFSFLFKLNFYRSARVIKATVKGISKIFNPL